ncbi:hypothetical protein FRC07_012032 [Ceratobasidium sp. 392]|nr:hypothetical protein FRC07_012032 [Ceratobasidium sp. 392]
MSSNRASVPDGYEIIADFSHVADPTPVLCQYTGECKNPEGRIILPGQRSTYIKAGNEKSYLLCGLCEDYVMTKKKTIVRSKTVALGAGSSHSQQSSTLHSVNPALIEAATNASQRGDFIRQRVAAVPQLALTQAAVSLGQQAPYSPNSRFTQGPSTFVLRAGLPSQGYSSAHATHYPALKLHAQQLRLASDPLQLEVSARITGTQLKELVLETARPHWIKNTLGYPLQPEIFTLRLPRSFIDLERDFPDTYAIYDRCLTKSAKGKGRFAYGKDITVILMLDNDAFETITSHIADVGAQTEETSTTSVSSTRQESHQSQKYDNANLARTPVRMTVNRTPRAHTPAHATATPHSQTPSTAIQPPISHTSCSEYRSTFPPVAHTSTPTTAVRLPSRHTSRSEHPPTVSTLPAAFHGPTISTNPVTPKRKRILPTSPGSPTLSPPHKRSASYEASQQSQSLTSASLAIKSKTRLEDALRKHGREVQVSNSTGVKSCFIQFFGIPKVSYRSLVEDNSQPLTKLVEDFAQMNNGTVSYNTSDPDTILGSGQFKHCFLGKITLENPPWPGIQERSLRVALKRPFTSNPTRSKGTTRFPPDVELKNIITEGTVLQWGSTLLDQVYERINKMIATMTETDDIPPIPSMRFVSVGIAKCIGQGQRTNQSLLGAFLVEEEIPRSHRFVRFLGNASASPFSFPSDDVCNRIAQFCAFAQHVQWTKTEGQGYCADWQGGVHPMTGDVLLTDPQLITNPDLGALFADGNVPETYLAFPTEHNCKTNPFCNYFKPGPIVLPAKNAEE